jgi:hypothetical protein
MIWDQFFTAELGVFPRKSAFSGVVQGGDSLFDRVGGQAFPTRLHNFVA